VKRIFLFTPQEWRKKFPFVFKVVGKFIKAKMRKAGKRKVN
jgi:hypothetical protein